MDSFPIPMCDVKRANTSTSDLKWADGSGCLATYGHCATKGLETFFGFRGHVIATVAGIPVDFAIANANIDDRQVFPLLAERGRYPIVLGDKGYVSKDLQALRSNQKSQYPEVFRKQQVRLRRRIETTLRQLTDQFSVARVRARTLWTDDPDEQ